MVVNREASIVLVYTIFPTVLASQSAVGTTHIVTLGFNPAHGTEAKNNTSPPGSESRRNGGNKKMSLVTQLL